MQIDFVWWVEPRFISYQFVEISVFDFFSLELSWLCQWLEIKIVGVCEEFMNWLRGMYPFHTSTAIRSCKPYYGQSLILIMNGTLKNHPQNCSSSIFLSSKAHQCWLWLLHRSTVHSYLRETSNLSFSPPGNQNWSILSWIGAQVDRQSIGTYCCDEMSWDLCSRKFGVNGDSDQWISERTEGKWSLCKWKDYVGKI